MKRQTSITYQDSQTYFLTTTVTEFTHIFQIPELAKILMENLNFYIKNFEIELHGFVIMPNHFHLLLTMGNKGNVSQFMGQIKEYSAKQVIKWCKKNNKNKLLNTFTKSANKHQPTHEFQVWQTRFDDLVIYNEKTFRTKLQYIHNNPLQEHWQLAKRQEDYSLSSAQFYLKDKEVGVTIAPLTLI